MPGAASSIATGPFAAGVLLLAVFFSVGAVRADDPKQCPESAAPTMEDPAVARAKMVESIRRYSQQSPHPISTKIEAAMARVPRHEFVPASQRGSAYADEPLPIGHGQTISQPYIVALMTELADLDADDTVLEIGTGSGYQAAVLSGLVERVYTVEIVEPLGRYAESTLSRLGYRNVEVRIGDGWMGWPEHAPYDAILVTAAPDSVPPSLVAQLKRGGRMVVPVGAQGSIQELTVLEKLADGSTTTREVLPVRFVPMTGNKLATE